MGLDDFGGGYDPDDPDKEDVDMLELSKWLAQPDVQVYWDRDKTYGFGTFSTGMAETPDIFVDSKVNNFAVEVKPPDESGKVVEGARQAVRYWENIENGDAEYHVNGEVVDVDGVLLATRHSMRGHLFKTDRGKDPIKEGRSRGATDVVEAGHMPQTEHAGSEACIRSAYQFAKRWFDNSEQDTTDTGFGALYSSALDGDIAGSNTVPAAFHISPGNGRQSHAWEYIPFYKKPDK